MISLNCSCDCHCGTCKHYHSATFTSFAKYSDLQINPDLLTKIDSSEYASKYFCTSCHNFIFMHYHNSPNIWIVTTLFQFDANDIEHYDIFKKNH